MNIDLWHDIRNQFFRVYELFTDNPDSHFKNEALINRLVLSGEKLENPAEFIDSVIRGIPTTSMYFNGQVYMWTVIDGNKRLGALKDFYNDKFPLADDIWDQKVGGRYYSELRAPGSTFKVMNAFERYSFTASIFNPGMKPQEVEELTRRIKSK